MHVLTAKNALPPLNVYSVALYPKAKAPPTVTTKLINDKMWEFIAFTKKNQNTKNLVHVIHVYANKVLEKNLPYTCNMNIHMYISLISIMIFNITYIYINI